MVMLAVRGASLERVWGEQVYRSFRGAWLKVEVEKWVTAVEKMGVKRLTVRWKK